MVPARSELRFEAAVYASPRYAQRILPLQAAQRRAAHVPSFACESPGQD